MSRLPNGTHKYTDPSQPERPDRHLFEFENYIGHDKKKWLGVTLDVADIAKFYQPDLKNGVDRWPYNDHEWDFGSQNEYIPFQITGAKQAMRAINDLEFPRTIRFNGEKNSRELIDAFDEVARKLVLHNQMTGRVDRRKNLQVAKGFATGDMDIERIRPYRRVAYQDAQLPVVAIVASGSWGESWHDSSYIPRVLTLTLAIQWACEATGLKVWSGLEQGNCDVSPKSEYKGAQLTYRLSNPMVAQPVRNYISLLHRSLFHWGYMCALGADGPALLKIEQLEHPDHDSIHDATYYIHHGFPSMNGGYAVHHVRQTINPDIVIAIGNILDKGDADINIDSGAKLELAIHKIAEQARSLRLAPDER